MKFARLLSLGALGMATFGCATIPKRQVVQTVEPSGLEWVKIVAKGIE